MFNRENIKVRPLSEELEGIGLDPDRVMDDIERNSGLLEAHAGSPPTSEAVRPLYEEDLGGGDDGGSDGDDIEIVLGEGINSLDEGLVEWDGDDLEEGEEIEYLGEKLVKVKRGYRMKTVDGKKKLVKVTKAEKRKERKERMKKRGKLKTAARMYAKRFKTKIKKRRMRLKKKGKAGKGRMWRQVAHRDVADQLQQLREELEQSDVYTGDVSPVEEAAINAGWLALLLGECFEAMGDVEVGEMLYRMSDTAADLSEEIEANGGEMSEEIEGKLTSLLEGVTKALATHEEIGSPSLFESIQMGVKNGLYEDDDDDDDENDYIDEEGDDTGTDGDDSDDDGIDFDDDDE